MQRQTSEHAPSIVPPGPPPARLGWSWALFLLVWVALPFHASSSDPPLRWRWSNPRPHGGNIVDMAYGPHLGVTIQVAELGQIYSSVDLNFWVPRESGTTNDLRAVTFFVHPVYRRILVTGANGTVLYADSPTEFRAGTLLTGPTGNWLEAVTSSSVLAVAVGDNGAIYTSTNGIHWTKQNSGTAQWLRGVAWGNGVFVAVGENGKVLTSVNGTNWVGRPSGTTAHFNRVTFSNQRFLAVGEGGESRYSANNGVDWFPEVTGATFDLFSSVSSGSTRLVVGDQEVRSQEGTAAWINELARLAGGPTPWTYYTALRPPDFFLIGGRTGLMEEGHPSTNSSGLRWLPGDESFRNWLWDVTVMNSPYVAVGDRATVMTSGNGADWRLEVVPNAVTNSIFLGVGGTPDMLVAAGNAGTLIISPNVTTNYSVTNIVGTNVIVTNVTGSAFGVLWHALTKISTNDLQGVGATTNLFVVTGASGTILTSPDATNWIQRASPTLKFLSGVTPWPGGWVAVGDDGAVVTSANGLNWNPVAIFTGDWLYRVHFLGGKLIAVGQNGAIYTSTNATTWTRQNSGTTKWLNDVTYLNETWYVVGNSGTILSSTNSVNWTAVGCLTRKNLYAAATDSRQLVAVGIEGVILRSQVVADPTPIQILSYDRVSTNTPNGGTLAQNLYLFGGRPDQRFTLDYGSVLETNSWIAGPELEFFDGSGTLFYLETIVSTNPPPREFYRATLIQP